MSVQVRAVLPGDDRAPSYAWLHADRGPQGVRLDVVVTARTTSAGWREPGPGQRVDVWSWTVPSELAAQWEQQVASGTLPVWSSPGSPEQWLYVRRGGQQVSSPRADRRAVFGGVCYRGLPVRGEWARGEVIVGRGFAASRDLNVATENGLARGFFAILGTHGRVAGERPGVPPRKEVWFAEGLEFVVMRAGVVEGLDVVLLHQRDPGHPDAPAEYGAEELWERVTPTIRSARERDPVRVADATRFRGLL